MTGYLHANYARSLAELGRPRELSHSRGWILERDVPRGTERDGMGLYPLFTCLDWSGLPHDLEELRDDIVSVGLLGLGLLVYRKQKHDVVDRL